MTTTVDPDETLVFRAGRGEADAIQALVSAKLPRVLRLAYRMLGDAMAAEDVAQEAMLRVWRQAPNWKPGQARFDTWLHQVAMNLCYDRLRKKRETLTDKLPETIDPQPLADQRLTAEDDARQVRAALEALPDRQREAIVLCHYQELTNIAAADIMEVSVEALESLLARGRRGLKAALSDLAPKGAER